MKAYKWIHYAAVGLLGPGLGMTSCADSLDLSPIDYYGAGNFWQTEEQAVGNITAQMSQFRSKVFQSVILYGEIRGGAYTRSSTGSDGSSLNYQYLRDQNLSQTNYGISNFGSYWGNIAAANLFIYNVEGATYFSDEDTKNFVKGEALVWRAFAYFKLLQYYSPYDDNQYGIPVFLKPYDDPGNAMPERKTQVEVYEQILSDCEEAGEFISIWCPDISFYIFGLISDRDAERAG